MNSIIKFIETLRESKGCIIQNLVLHVHSHPEFFGATMSNTSFRKTLDERHKILDMNGYEGPLLEVCDQVGGYQ